MLMSIIPTRVHGLMDYLMGILLIAAPWVFGFAAGGAETWVPVVVGAGMILAAMMTDFEVGVTRMISMPTHLMLDLGAGALLAASPWLFGFADVVSTPHLVLGLIEISTALMTSRVPTGRRVTA